MFHPFRGVVECWIGRGSGVHQRPVKAEWMFGRCLMEAQIGEWRFRGGFMRAGQGVGGKSVKEVQREGWIMWSFVGEAHRPKMKGKLVPGLIN